MTEKLIDELFAESGGIRRCPYIQKDERGAYCGKDFSGRTVSEHRRAVCDVFSLQFWCLHPTDYERCVYFKRDESVK